MSQDGRAIDIIIDAKGVWKRYDAGKHKIEALRGLDLQVRRGEVVAIMGEWLRQGHSAQLPQRARRHRQRHDQDRRTRPERPH